MYSKQKRRRTTAFRSDPIAYMYSGQIGGASLPYFVGRQYGGGWLRNLLRIAFPIAKKALTSVGSIASSTAQNLLSNENKGFKESLKDAAMTEAKNVLKAGVKRAATAMATPKPPPPPSSSINKAKKRRKHQQHSHHTIFGKR